MRDAALLTKKQRAARRALAKENARDFCRKIIPLKLLLDNFQPLRKMSDMLIVELCVPGTCGRLSDRNTK